MIRSHLTAIQSEMMAAILDDTRPMPPQWGEREAAGLAIYRNNYRSALMAAMEESYPRTRAWVGEQAYAQAAAHHLITHPPVSWTLDDVGNGFADTLAELFRNDSDVSELASVEWAMQMAFVAADAPALTALAFANATADFSEDDWEALCLALHPSVSIIFVRYDITEIWARTAEGPVEDANIALLAVPMACIVHRTSGGQAAFAMTTQLEGEMLCHVGKGIDFGTLCSAIAQKEGEAEASPLAGAMLAHWLQQGWLAV